MARKTPSAGKNVTIADATGRGGMIDRKKANRMLDPHDYFGKNKRKNGLREYLRRVELERRC
jgi:hypothetical protein